MAKHQYRISTDSNGTSNFGFAYLAVVNPSGSGKKITFRSIEVACHYAIGSAANGNIACSLYRCDSPLNGEDMLNKSVLNDSSASVPSSFVVRRNSMPTGNLSILRRANVGKRVGLKGTENRLLFGCSLSTGKRGKSPLSGRIDCAIGGFSSEPVTLGQNEAIALVVDQRPDMATLPVRVSIIASINGKTISYDFNANAYPGLALFSVENSGTDVVSILSWSVMDMGTTDTPTLKIVPIGQMYSGDILDDSKKNVGISKMDSSYPDFVGGVYTDIGFIPKGVPVEAISPSSVGTPKGMNYLHTRDFYGPVYRSILVEPSHINNGVRPDSFGMSYGHVGTDLLGRMAGITLNQGEGLAIVNSCETAAGTTEASFGAWQPMTFSAQIDVEPATSPFLNLTGLVTGSDIVVLEAGTSNILQQIDEYSGPSWAWNYDQDSVSSVDICIYKAGYIPFSVRSVALGSGGASIPIKQILDRNYL